MPHTIGAFSRTVAALIFLSSLALFCIGTVAIKKDAVSLQEKRSLAPFPAFFPSMEKIPEWTKGFDSYIQDHFVFRDKLIAINALLRLRLFNVNKSSNWIVLPGKDGWLFYLGDWAIHNYLKKPSAEDEEAVRLWARVLSFRQSLLAKKGANYLVVIAPNKEDLHPEYFPERFVQRRGTTMLELFRRQMKGSQEHSHLLDLTEPLLQAKKTAQVYFKTDTHWNNRGAYVAYRAIMERIQLWHPEATALQEEQFAILKNSFGGDMVLIMGLSGIVAEPNEIWRAKQPCANPKNTLIKIEGLPEEKSLKKNGCQTGAPLRVLVIADSFAEGMRKFLNETFQQVVYSRETPFQFLYHFMDEYQPDLVLDLRVSRNLPKVMTPNQEEEAALRQTEKKQ